MVKNNLSIRDEGFTLTELLISSIVVILVFTVIWSIYIFIQTQWQEGYVTMKLERDASITIEKMIRGITGQNGIREAKSVSPPADDGSTSPSIDFTGHLDDVVRRFEFSADDNTIHYVPDITEASDETIASGVQSLTFSRNGSLITIDLTLEEAVRNRSIEVHLQTHVELRN